MRTQRASRYRPVEAEEEKQNVPPPNSRKGRSGGTGGSQDRRRLIEVRRRFLLDGTEPDGSVPPTIIRSWRRSQVHGLDMDLRPALESVSHGQLRELRERNEMLLRAARGELEALYDDARASGSIVILTDPMGVVLATVGSIDFAERASRVALRPGVQWSEAAIGTNAIGTAIAEGAPVNVDGAEHFFPEHAILGCSAVPIFDPSGEIIGVLDLSYDAGGSRAHTLALVRRAVDQIERRLFEQRFGRHERVHFHTDPDLVMGPHEGLLAFDGNSLVGANRQGLELLDLDWSAIGYLSYDQIFATRRELIGANAPIEENRLRSRRGSLLFGRILRPDASAAQHRVTVPPPPRQAPRALFDRRVRVLLERAVRLIDAGVSVLVVGEIGCGKDAFAREVHNESRLHDGPFVVVDCSLEDMGEVEQRLFGGADEGDGALAAAAGGSLYLHTVEVLPLRLQARLARSLGAGDDKATRGPRPFNLLSSSHYALADRVAAGGFSADLHLRLATHTVTLEPVRQHPDRRGLIVELWKAVAPTGIEDRLPEVTLDVLAAYGWPGNRRQLISTLRALVVLADAGETPTPEVLPHEITEAMPRAAPPPVALDVEEGLESITLAAMRAALEAEGGNVARAARRLGIHRSTLYRRLNEIGGD